MFKAVVLPYLVNNAQKKMKDFEEVMRQQANQQTYTHQSNEGNVNIRFDKQQPTNTAQKNTNRHNQGDDYIEYEEVE